MTGVLSAGERARLLRRVAAGRGPDAAPASPADDIPNRAPATYAQEQLWFLDQLVPGTPNYNVPFVFTLSGPLDVPALRAALAQVARRHTALRTVLRRDGGELVQVVGPPPADVPLPVEDYSAEADPAAAAWRRCQELVREPFTLSELPLWRARLLRIGMRKHLLLWVASHAIADGWAVGLLSQELAGCYRAARGTGAPLPPPTAQLTRYAIAQRNRLDEHRLTELLEFWQSALDGCTPLGFPYDHPRPAAPSFAGATHAFCLPSELVSRLAEAAADLGTTPFAVALAAYQALLAAYCGHDDIAVGIPVAGRDEPETYGLFGSLVNTVVVRTGLHGDPAFSELVRRVSTAALDAWEHAELPFGKLVEHLRPARADRYSPLVHTVFSYGSTPFTDVASELETGVAMTLAGVSNGTVRFDFELALDQSPDGWTGRLEYSAELLTPQSARLFCDRYVRLLREALRDPHQPLSSVTAELDDAMPAGGALPADPTGVRAVARCPAAAALAQAAGIGPSDTIRWAGPPADPGFGFTQQVADSAGAALLTGPGDATVTFMPRGAWSPEGAEAGKLVVLTDGTEPAPPGLPGRARAAWLVRRPRGVPSAALATRLMSEEDRYVLGAELSGEPAVIVTAAGRPALPGAAGSLRLAGRELWPGQRVHRLPDGRLALAIRDRDTASATGPARIPGNAEIEQTLLRLWREALGTQAVGPDDDFFTVGGHSMLAASLVATIRETFGCELTLVEFFQALTVRALTPVIASRLAAPETSPEISEEVLERVAQMSDDEVAELLAQLTGG